MSVLKALKSVLLATLMACFLALLIHAQTAPNTQAAQAGITISAQDMSVIVVGLRMSSEALAQLAANAEERKSFAKDIREILAVAEEARAAGYAARPAINLQLELARSFVIAQAYFKTREPVANKDQLVAPAEIEALFKLPRLYCQPKGDSFG